MDRLEVNVNKEVARVLRRITEEEGITVTEAVRRAISILNVYHLSSALGMSFWVDYDKNKYLKLDFDWEDGK